MNLLIDIGNSCSKLWSSSQGELSSITVVDSNSASLQMAIEALRFTPARVLVSSVANAALNTAVATLCHQAWDCQAEFAKTQAHFGDVVLAYPDYKSFGVDRWLAMIKARALSSQACMVVDCGTATTIDVMDARGQHLGGLIMPGINTMLTSLATDTHQLPNVLEQQGMHSNVLASDTTEGILSGARTSTLATVEYIFQLYQAQDEPLICYITGGDAQFIMPSLSLAFEYHEDLVLQGLKLWGDHT